MNRSSSGTAGVETTTQLKSAFKYDQQSLPLILTEYGFEDKAAEKLRKQREEEKQRRKAEKKQKKKTSSFDDAEDERELQKAQERDENYLQMVRDLYRLRDYYYNEYSSLLNDKVRRQRREIRERDDDKRKQREQKEEEEKEASHHVKKRLERNTLATTPLPKRVPKTDLYYIVGLEDKLRREGKIKTPTDYNKFRQEIEQPNVFYTNFKVNKHMDYNNYPSIASDHHSTHSHGESNDHIFPLAQRPADNDPQQPRSLSRISETHESSRPGTRTESWAVTQQYPAQFRQRKSISNVQIGKTKSSAQSDLDKRFPKLEMPKLHCFTLNLAEKPPDPEEVRLQSEIKKREKERKKMARTVTKMYQLAMSNAAVSARIMDQHEDMDMILNGPDLCDVIADHHWMEAYGLREIEPEVSPAEHLGDDSVGENGQYAHQALPEIPSRESSAKSVRSGTRDGSRSSKRSSAKSRKSLTEAESKPPLPLTIGEIREKCNIKEAKTLSTLWTNYLRAGRNEPPSELK